MQFNPQNMPRQLNEDSIYFGMNVDPDDFRESEPEQRAVFMRSRRDRKKIKNLAENYFSHFSDRLLGEAFQNNLMKMEDDSTEFLFVLFGSMLIPLSGSMQYGDLRNQGVRDFIAEYSNLDFDAVTLNPMYCQFNPESEKNSQLIKAETDMFIGAIKANMQEYGTSINEIAVCLAVAYMGVHPTIQQCFMRSLCQTAAILGRNHTDKEIEIKSADLLKVISTISSTENHCFPMI